MGRRKILTGFERTKQDALLTARQLFYDEDIIKRIKNAKTEREIEMALTEGRKRM